MTDAKVGDEFITHAFGGAIAIQERIVDAVERLGTVHPFPDARQAIAGMQAA